jgi:hypothetical protein
MTAFRRTTSGIQNQHLFHNVDLIVFVEGGPVSFTKAEVDEGNFTEVSNDVVYWRNVFSRFKSDSIIKFKSIGSKNTIKAISEDIIQNNISTVLVAMDNEFDEILGQRVAHKNVFYTYGYSWENDIWNENIVIDIINEVSGVEIDRSMISKNLAKFLKEIKYAVFCDGYLFSKGNSLFPRSKGTLAFVNCNSSDLPHIKSEELKNRIDSKGVKKSTVYGFARRKNIETKRHCFGHLLADYCYQLIMHFLKNRLNMPSVHKEIASRMGINKFFRNYFESSAIYEHYRVLFAR